MKQEQSCASQTRDRGIPSFRSVAEEAAFWDSHDSADFEYEFTEATDVRFARAAPKKGITVRLEEASLEQLTQEARQQGIHPSTLARMWILEHLNRGQPAEHA